MPTESVESLLLKIAPDLLTADLVDAITRIADRPVAFEAWRASLGAIGDAFVTSHADTAVAVSLGVMHYGTPDQVVCATVTVSVPSENIVLDGVVSGSRHASKTATALVRTPAARAFPATVDTLRDTLDVVSAELSAKLAEGI